MGEEPGGREAVHARHPDVHQDEVGRAAAGKRDRLNTVRGLADDLDVGFGFEDRPQPAAYHGLVVGEQHADGRHRSLLGAGSTAWTRQPRPSGLGPASSLPPASAARSRIPAMPLPWPTGPVRRAPSSVTSMNASPLVRWIDTAARGGRA